MTRTIALVAVLATTLASAPAAAPHYYYIDPARLDLSILLPPPPDAASAAERSDEEEVAAAVAGRSPQQFFEAEEASKRSVFFFAASIGPSFAAAKLPVTARLFLHVRSDVGNLINAAKMYWDRPRPAGAQKRRGSYPSGHAAFAASTAILLSQLVPAKRDEIFSQARTFAENRILLGLHYPSDVASGWTAGTLAAYVMMHDRAFERDFAAARAELLRANI